MVSRDDIVSKRFLNNEKEVLRNLNDIYSSAQDEIKEKIQAQSERISNLTEIINQLDKDDPQRVLLESERQSAVYQKSFQENLDRQIDEILGKMNTKQFATISDYLSKCYDEGFLGTLYSIQGQGVPLSLPINQQAVVRAIQLDSKISTGLYRKLGVDTQDLKKRIASSISEMMVTGGNYYDVQRKIDEVAHIGFNKSFRIARTEGHRIQCAAQNDCMIDVKDRGADIVKQWSSTLDGRTRNSHVFVDMEVREIGEKFSNGLEFPGDPIAPASEVVNCRCGLRQRARMLLDRAFMKRDGFTGEIREFASPDDYNEFKKWYFSDENRAYMKHLQQLEDKYQTKNFKKVLESMTDSEYKKFKELEAKTPFFNHVGENKLKYTFKSDVDKNALKPSNIAVNKGKFISLDETKAKYKNAVDEYKQQQKELHELRKQLRKSKVPHERDAIKREIDDGLIKLDRLKQEKLKAWEKYASHPDYTISPKRLGKIMRGKEMSFEDADNFNVNPNYGKKGYDINCQSCVVTFEARRRGYDVVVLGNKSGSVLDDLSHHPNFAWIDPKTGLHPEYIYPEGKTLKKRIDEIDRIVGRNGERYSIEFDWKGKQDGHVINLDRDENGQLRLKDNQRGKGEENEWAGIDAVNEYLKRVNPSSIRFIRIDNMAFDEDIVTEILTGR